MRIAVAHLRSLSPYSQSRKHNVPKLEKEGPVDYEIRTWRERLHINEEGFVFIPGMAFKFSLETAAKYLRMRIPGKGQSEYGKHFVSGILVPVGLTLPVKKEDVPGEWLSLHANGKRGSGKRVDRCMPYVALWKGKVEYYILDDTITPGVFETHLREAGNFIGIGRFRPENGGFLGRYEVVNITWKEVGLPAE